VRWQPISPTLMAHPRHHAGHHHTPPDDQLLRSITGRPITTRHYDHLWTRLGKHLPWVATQQISTHWLRHTTPTWVERNFGHAVAKAYAGHTDTHHQDAKALHTSADRPWARASRASPPSSPAGLANVIGYARGCSSCC
jgi:integrase/recombinase XerC